MKNTVCVVRNCGTKQLSGETAVGHRFPNNVNIGNMWVKCAGNEELNNLTFQDIVKRRFFVCAKHFEKKCFLYTGKGVRKLFPNSVPSLDLPQISQFEKIDVEQNNPGSVNSQILERMEHSTFGELNYWNVFSTELVSIKNFKLLLNFIIINSFIIYCLLYLLCFL